MEMERHTTAQVPLVFPSESEGGQGTFQPVLVFKAVYALVHVQMMCVSHLALATFDSNGNGGCRWTANGTGLHKPSGLGPLRCQLMFLCALWFECSHFNWNWGRWFEENCTLGLMHLGHPMADHLTSETFPTWTPQFFSKYSSRNPDIGTGQISQPNTKH